MSLDLTRSLPPEVTLDGLGAPQYDGAHWYRSLPGAGGALRLKTAFPSYQALHFQSLSKEGAYTLTTSLDGQELRRETVGKNDLHSAYVDLGLSVGTHTVRWSVRCEGGNAACLPLRLYAINTQLAAERDAGAGRTLLAAGLAALLALLLIGLLLRGGSARAAGRP